MVESIKIHTIHQGQQPPSEEKTEQRAVMDCLGLDETPRELKNMLTSGEKRRNSQMAVCIKEREEREGGPSSAFLMKYSC